MSVKVRFAPSPTGALHIGGVRTALYNYLFAKKNNGVFILRIEDTDQGRYVPGAEKYIVDALEWCGISPQEGLGYGGPAGPYRQSERKDIYMQYALKLVHEGKAYIAFDTEEDLDKMRTRLADEGIAAPKYDATVRMQMQNSLSLTAAEVELKKKANQAFVVRLKVDPGQIISYMDLVREEINFDSSELDDKVLIKADGMPTYHMANVIDDHLMQISHVIRGEEWLSSTAHHLLLYRAFNWEPPRFAHLPLILRPDGKGKLSKRDGAKFGIPVFPLSWKGHSEEDSFEGFREYGFEPQAVLNFLAFLGWNPGTEQEIFSLEELIEAFTIENIGKSGARFDIDKANWFNQHYLRLLPDSDLAKRLKPLIESKGWHFDLDKTIKIVHILKDRTHKLPDFISLGSYLFGEPADYDKIAFVKNWKPENKEKLYLLIEKMESAPSLEAQELEVFLKDQIKEIAIKPGEIYPLFRLALSGSLQGPTVFQMISALGRSGIERLKSRLDLMQKEHS